METVDTMLGAFEMGAGSKGLSKEERDGSWVDGRGVNSLVSLSLTVEAAAWLNLAGVRSGGGGGVGNLIETCEEDEDVEDEADESGASTSAHVRELSYSKPAVGSDMSPLALNPFLE